MKTTGLDMKKVAYTVALGVFGLCMVNMFGLVNVMLATVGAVCSYLFDKTNLKEKGSLISRGFVFTKTNDSYVAFKNFKDGRLSVFDLDSTLNVSIHLTQNQITAIQNHTADDFNEVEVVDIELDEDMKDLNGMGYKLLKGDAQSFDVMFKVFENGVYVFCFDGDKKYLNGIFMENVIYNEAMHNNTTTTALVVA
ncbi:hypothetical protein [Bacillus cereus group sp. BfR-BA-01317]|uniref:hypothetical protein n=1 Tax=Bacillus cereus group sp. BfR-BA-01317 TaxID=2920294 RepID=UPI001F5A85C7|nr:hypothetical protein [Bacillus cereus group sp. BfR-BA-01317]